MRALRTNKNITPEVDCIILCGGYSVRLRPITTDTSKVLLPIAGKPVLQYVLDFVQNSHAIKKTILSVNQKFAPQIQNFLKSYKPKIQHNPIELTVEPTTTEKDKLGPIGALDYITTRSAPRDLLVLGGDNLFGFQLNDFLKSCNNETKPCSHNAVYWNQTKDINRSEYGTVRIDTKGNFLEFHEKTMNSKHKNISTACYFFKEDDIAAIHKYIEDNEDPDSIGDFIHWLLATKKAPIRSFIFSSFWFDIGTRESFLKANKHYIQHSIYGDISDTIFNKPIYVAKEAIISRSKLGSFVTLGVGTQVRDSFISNSIIMEHCFIQNCTISNSIIGPESIVKDQTLDAICISKSKLGI